MTFVPNVKMLANVDWLDDVEAAGRVVERVMAKIGVPRRDARAIPEC